MPAWDKYEPKPGLTFYSPYAAFQFVARSSKPIYSADGTQIDEIPELLVEFARFGESHYVDDPEHDGESILVADVRGHYANLDEQAEEKGWSEDEWKIVCKRLLWYADRNPGTVRLWSKAPIQAPWPKYDKTHHSQIATLAEQLGLLAESLAYEQENKKRETVVKALKEALAKAQAEQVDEESLTAA